MRTLPVRTADISIQALQSMHQSLGKQEIQRAIDRGRDRFDTLGGKAVEQAISADWLVAGPYQFEDAAAYRGEARAVGLAGSFGGFQRVPDAIPMVVLGGWK